LFFCLSSAGGGSSGGGSAQPLWRERGLLL